MRDERDLAAGRPEEAGCRRHGMVLYGPALKSPTLGHTIKDECPDTEKKKASGMGGGSRAGSKVSSGKTS